jgi:hypothetical protein
LGSFSGRHEEWNGYEDNSTTEAGMTIDLSNEQHPLQFEQLLTLTLKLMAEKSQ